MVAVRIVRVAAAVIQGRRETGRAGGQVSAVDVEPIVCPADLGRVCVERRVVGRGVEAGRAERVAVEVGLAAALPHVLIAVIDLTFLRGPARVVVPYCM